MTYKDTQLWQRAAVYAEERNALSQWRRLETAYDRFWDKAIRIAGLISQELPGLTLHDEKHLEAVWKTADLIAGDNFSMTPLEVFIFGGAVLLHDLGHTVTVYEGGADAIKQTDEWRQAVLWRLDLADDDPNPSDETFLKPGKDIEAAALFDALRSLHAGQAEVLCRQSYEGPYGPIFLLDDDELRPHLGQVIGRVAASHHWDRETLREQLGGRRGPFAMVPDLGTLQPVKLACLLRCADACQIDQRRAPDIDYALHQPDGTSKQHWNAQNRLSLPHRDQETENSITFTSTFDFEEENADAWWIAHDLVHVAHQELQECDALMRDQGLQAFAVKGVAGASDSAALSEKIRTSGWKPVDASLRISDPRQMVELFGGKNYYGEHALWVAVRELLQNGIDAIEARRVLEDENSHYKGGIFVEQEASELDGKEGVWLRISDDGIGMSERVLTRTLVDFGRSAKKTGELTHEFRGLRGKRVPTIGQFGIGFFSVLMLSNHVLVETRPLNGGDSDARKLRFSWGPNSRPLLLSPDRKKLAPSISTCVSLFVENEQFERLLGSLGHQNKNLIKLVQMVAPLPNCRIHVSDSGGNSHLARSPELYVKENAYDWLTSIVDNGAQEELIARAAANLTPVKNSSGAMTGWATFDFQYGTFGDRIEGLGMRTERGICAQEPGLSGRNKDDGIIGVLPCIDTGPRRDRASKPKDDTFKAWLSSQMKMLKPDAFSLEERDSLSGKIYRFGGDPLGFCTVMIQPIMPYKYEERWFSLGDFVKYYFELDQNNAVFDRIIDNISKNMMKEKWEEISNEPYFIVSDDTLREDIGMNGLFFAMPNIIGNMHCRYKDMKFYGCPDLDDDYGLIGCLRRLCEQRGLSLVINDVKDEFIGLSRDDETGQLSEIYTENAVQIRIRPQA